MGDDEVERVKFSNVGSQYLNCLKSVFKETFPRSDCRNLIV